MIKTKDDLKFYLNEDKKRYNLKLPWRIGVYIGHEPSHAFRMTRALRLYEYSINNSSSFIGKARLLLRSYRFRILSYKYRIYLKPNVIGYGLRIVHFGGGVIINCKQMGNYCTITSGVVVGNKGSIDNTATIGNNVEITLGSKIIGGISIGNGVIVAPNSVVVKDVPDNCVVSGIPAKLLISK